MGTTIPKPTVHRDPIRFHLAEHHSSPLGYRTYAFTARDTSTLDPAAALSMYTWDDRSEQAHRELNISISAWGDPRNTNAQYVLQFEDVADNVFRYAAFAGVYETCGEMVFLPDDTSPA